MSETILACVPADESARRLYERLTGRPCVPYQDSEAGVCADCTQPVWVGPAQRKMLLSVRARVLCFFCASRAIAGGGAAVVPLTDKQPGG